MVKYLASTAVLRNPIPSRLGSDDVQQSPPILWLFYVWRLHWFSITVGDTLVVENIPYYKIMPRDYPCIYLIVFYWRTT